MAVGFVLVGWLLTGRIEVIVRLFIPRIFCFVDFLVSVYLPVHLLLSHRESQHFNPRVVVNTFDLPAVPLLICWIIYAHIPHGCLLSFIHIRHIRKLNIGNDMSRLVLFSITFSVPFSKLIVQHFAKS